MQVNAIVGEVIPTRVQLTFSQLQNFIASIAIERDYNYYFWGHADVALVASNATASFAEEVLQCVATHLCKLLCILLVPVMENACNPIDVVMAASFQALIWVGCRVDFATFSSTLACLCSSLTIGITELSMCSLHPTLAKFHYSEIQVHGPCHGSPSGLGHPLLQVRLVLGYPHILSAPGVVNFMLLP